MPEVLGHFEHTERKKATGVARDEAKIHAKQSFMLTTVEVYAELEQCLNDTGTAHYFSMLGLQYEKARIPEMLEILARIGNVHTEIVLGNGSPVGYGWSPFLAGSLRELYSAPDPGAKIT